MKKLGMMIFCLSMHAHAYTSYVPMAQALNESGTELGFDLEYFKPTSIVTEEGEGQALTANNNVSYLQLNTRYQYGFTGQFQGTLYAGFRSVQSNFTESNADYSISKAGFEHAGVGFQYSFLEENRTQYALLGYYLQKMYSNQELDATTRLQDTNLGDEGREYGLGAAVSMRTSSMNYYEFQAIYRSPADYLSSEILSFAQLSLVWDYFSLYGGVENVYSLEDSPYSSDESSRPNYAIINSKLYNSINRSWTAPYLGFQFTLGTNWRMGLRYTQVYTGNSTDIGPRLLLSLARRSEQKKDFAKQDSRFKEYRIEGVVSKLSKSKKLAVVDIGAEAGLKKGMRVDFYYFDYTGGNELIARGVALKVQSKKAVIKIKKRFGRRRIQAGTVVRSGLIDN